MEDLYFWNRRSQALKALFSKTSNSFAIEFLEPLLGYRLFCPIPKMVKLVPSWPRTPVPKNSIVLKTIMAKFHKSNHISVL